MGNTTNYHQAEDKQPTPKTIKQIKKDIETTWQNGWDTWRKWKAFLKTNCETNP